MKLYFSIFIEGCYFEAHNICIPISSIGRRNLFPVDHLKEINNWYNFKVHVYDNKNKHVRHITSVKKGMNEINPATYASNVRLTLKILKVEISQGIKQLKILR